MEPIEFPEANLVLAKDQPPFLPLPVHRTKDQVVSCWKLSPADVELIGRTKKIFVSQMNYGQPPMALLIAVSKKDIFDNVEEQIEEPTPSPINHHTTIKFGFWECLRMMFGSAAYYSSTIVCDRELRVIDSPNAVIYVPPLFKKKMGLMSMSDNSAKSTK